MAGKCKLELTFSEKATSELDELKEIVDASNRAETLRHALRWTYWCGKQVTDGGKILVEDATGKVVEVVFPKAKKG